MLGGRRAGRRGWALALGAQRRLELRGARQERVVGRRGREPAGVGLLEQPHGVVGALLPARRVDGGEGLVAAGRPRPAEVVGDARERREGLRDAGGERGGGPLRGRRGRGSCAAHDGKRAPRRPPGSPRGRLAHHARRDRVVRALVDEDERAGRAVAAVGVDRQRPGRPQPHPAEVVQRELGGRRARRRGSRGPGAPRGRRRRPGPSRSCASAAAARAAAAAPRPSSRARPRAGASPAAGPRAGRGGRRGPRRRRRSA